MDWEPLLEAARRARELAYAPYSGYRVGAALLFADGSVVAGGNVENLLPALSLCAERVAMAHAAAAGQRRPRALAVASGSSPPAAPCGLCRQTMLEFVDDLPVLLANDDGDRIEVRLAELIPRPFVWRPGGSRPPS